MVFQYFKQPIQQKWTSFNSNPSIYKIKYRNSNLQTPPIANNNNTKNTKIQNWLFQFNTQRILPILNPIIQKKQHTKKNQNLPKQKKNWITVVKLAHRWQKSKPIAKKFKKKGEETNNPNTRTDTQQQQQKSKNKKLTDRGV